MANNQQRPSGVLKNPRWELFAQNLAGGKSATEAHALAGFKRERKGANAARLKARPEIVARVAEILAPAAKKAATTAQDIARQLDEDRDFAKTKDQASAMVSATMGKAKVLGLIVDKQLQVTKRIQDMNREELKQFLGRA